ncbi:MAG: histidine kinase [Chitinophagaceae bacterium]|nr:histidine kinase [Chitinophagaceae bacterium]
MKKKIKWVLFLVFVFLIVIDVLQVIWIYNNYQEQASQYERSLTSALGEAMMRYQVNYVRKEKESTGKFYIIAGNEKLYPPVAGIKDSNQIIFTGHGISMDSIEGSLGYTQMVQMRNRNIFDIQLFDSIFKSTLKRNNIEAPYILDTMRTAKSKPSAHKQNVRSAGVTATKAIYPRSHNEFSVKTAAMMVNTYGDLFVYASFKPYPAFLQKKTAWILISSLLTFILTNIALLYVIKTIRKQKKITEIKDDFINNMTHELRTPITVASSAIDAILNHHGLEDQQKVRFYLQTSREELLHLDQLVEKILNMAVEDKEELNMHYEEIDLEKLISTIIDNHRLINDKKVQINFFAGEGATKVKADRIHLANALNNLVDNAIKYSNGPVQVDIACHKTANGISISVKDKGIGIPTGYLSEIFQAFFRVPHGNIHTVKGYGLGLSYAKKIIEKHNGSIEVQSVLNEGSTFILHLPLNEKHG